MNLRQKWSMAAGVTYLNHGSFGPSPLMVQQAREAWSRELESQPMDFLVRRLEPLLDEAAERLGKFVGCRGNDLVFVPNATVAMNAVAQSFPLRTDDEVLFTDHEYGAVMRIWRQRCQQMGAKVVTASIPFPPPSTEALVESLFSRVTDRTRLLVVSHITSPTAVIFPLQAICDRARSLKLPVCVDGPHAIAMLPVNLKQLGCDFYMASCHKWLSAPFGSGFLYVHSKHQGRMKPPVISWGRSLNGRPPRWQDEFHWSGTYDPAPYLAIPTAIDFLEQCGLDEFRNSTHQLVKAAGERIIELTGASFKLGDAGTDNWFGSMLTVPLPMVAPSEAQPGTPHPLQQALFSRYAIEVPIVEWHNQISLRVSCHLYNDEADISRLLSALQQLLPEFSR